MDTLTSAEFRKVYAKLTRPTIVTALGRPIGTWQPIAATLELNDGDLVLATNQSAASPLRDGIYRAGPAFNRRPFTPVPKKGK